MIFPGIASVTFRKRSIEEIVELAWRAALAGVEWGGDVHVPPGDSAKARLARELCRRRDLTISAYGSYYKAGEAGPRDLFETVLATAGILQTDTIRIWAGASGWQNTTPAHRKSIVADIQRCCDLAAQRGCKVATEWHAGTLTDDVRSAVELLGEVDRPNLRTFWQPPNQVPHAQAFAGLSAILPHLANLHVFQWRGPENSRLPLAAGEDLWLDYLKLAAEAGGDHFASLEFVLDDDAEQFLRDAQTLHRLVKAVNR